MTADDFDSVSYPVETPIKLIYDAETGELVVESIVLRAVPEGGPLRLQLTFSAEVAHGFLRVLTCVEEELGIPVGAASSQALN